MTSRGIIVLLLGLLIGVLGFSLVRWRQHLAHHHHLEADYFAQHKADGHHAELDWLRDELNVTPAQMEKIQALHVAYHPECERLTLRLEVSHAQLEKLTLSTTTLNPELETALKEHSDVHLSCQKAMLVHFYATASCLNSDQAKRYLEKMLPLVFEHEGSIYHNQN